jgi:MFS family permease
MFLGFVGITVIVETPIVGLGRSVFQFGVLSLPTTMSMLVAAPLVGRGITRFGPKPMVMAGAVLSTFGFLMLTTFHATYLELLLGPIPTFVGLVTMIVVITNIVVLTSRKGETGIQTGMSEMFQDLGASIGPVLVAAVLASFTGTFYVGSGSASVPVQLPTLAAFQWLFGLGAVLTAACGVLAVFLRNYTFPPQPAIAPAPGQSGIPTPAPGAE